MRKNALIWAFVVGPFGCCGALPWAWINLIGVPMQEASSMDPGQGWTALVLGLAAIAVGVALYRKVR